MEGAYSSKGKKKENELEDIDKCFEVITDKRETVIRMSKEAIAAVEANRNAAELAKAEKKSTTPVGAVETEEVKDQDQEKKSNSSNLLEYCPSN